jgi:hypothetical protein
VVAEVWQHTQEAGHVSVLMEVLQLSREGKVGKAIAVVGQEFFFAHQIFLNRLQSVTYI